MLKSMTGFGRAEQLTEGYLIKIQIKSVNHRYSDITVKAPRYYAFLEEKVRSAAMSKISRGKIEIFVSVEQKEDSDKEITLNKAVASQYINALKGLSEFDIKDDLSYSSLSRFQDIFDVEYKEIDEEKITEYVLSVFDLAMDGFFEMRRAEGERLKESLLSHLDTVISEVEYIEKRSPQCVNEYREKLRAKIEEVLNGAAVDETRIITEAAIYADKVSVDEETVRLKSHVSEFKKTMEQDEPVGKKLDFIVQEMNREANTTGSKCNDADIASHVVELKSTIEKIREQIQNIE